MCTRGGAPGRMKGPTSGLASLLVFDFFFCRRNHSGHSVMPGNSNTYVANTNDLVPPIVASKVRFVPHSSHKRTVCMRVEVFGCLYEDGVVR